MKANVDVEAGVCGFRTSGHVSSEDGQHVVSELQSDCAKIQARLQRLKGQEPIDAYQEIGRGAGGVVLGTAQDALPGCCAACAVPIALFKAMQVAAGLALPKDVAIRLSKE